MIPISMGHTMIASLLAKEVKGLLAKSVFSNHRLPRVRWRRDPFLRLLLHSPKCGNYQEELAPARWVVIGW
jgi:hypothetical protein